ncbi:hypothetical protein ACOMHN_015144 [Nucella lapillus]
MSLNESDVEMTSVFDDVFLPWANPHNVISVHAFLSFEKVMNCYVSLGLFFVGASTNVLNCIVFVRQGVRDRMNLCLFCLALVDLLFVFFFYLISSHCIVGYFYPGVMQEWNYFARKHFTGIYRGFLYSSGCLTALIALERCVCVVLPLKAASLLRTRTMAALIAGIVGLIQLAAVLYPLQLEVGSRVDPKTGRTTFFLSASDFHARYKVLYTIVEDIVLMVMIPFGTFIVVVISTIVTVLELNLRSRWRQLMSSGQDSAKQRQVKLVKMLVVVSCIYIVTAAPNVALGLARSLVPEFRHTRRYANIFLASHLMYLILAMTNSSINFFVYVTMSSKFRGQLTTMFGYKEKMDFKFPTGYSNVYFAIVITPAVSATFSQSEERSVRQPMSSLVTTDFPPLSLNQSDNGMTSASSDDVFLPWDNPYNVITLQTYQTFEKIAVLYVSAGVFVVGATSNVLNCVVFFRQGLRDRMNLCLFCRALVDLLFVTFVYVICSHFNVGYFHPGVAEWGKYYSRKYFTGIYRGFLYSSGCLTALIALERCVCVVLPLKAASLLRTRTMAALIAGIVGLIQLAAVLYPLQLRIGYRTDPDTGKTSVFLSATEFYYSHKLLYTIVEDTIQMVVIPFGTFIVVVISTIVTVLELNLRSRWRQLSSFSDGAATRQQVKLVKMLVVVSCIYIVTAAPNVALGLARSLVPEFRHTRRYANIFLASHLMYLILAMANSSINFFVYVTMSSRFRAQLATMGCCRGVTSEVKSEAKSGVQSKTDVTLGPVRRFRNALVTRFSQKSSKSRTEAAVENGGQNTAQ